MLLINYLDYTVLNKPGKKNVAQLLTVCIYLVLFK